MSSFWQLVRNENMKIYRRPRAWIMLSLLVAPVLLISILWMSFSEGDVSMWEATMVESAILFMLLTIFVVIIAASIVAEEFTSGTIKLLLVRPWSRSKILLSKYIAALLFSILLAATVFVSTIVINFLCFGGNSSSDTLIDPALMYQGESNPLIYMLKFYGMKMISLLVTVTLAFMISTIFRSGGLAIGLSLFILLGVNNFGMLLGLLDYKWVDYLLFMHLDLTQYIGAATLQDGSSFGFSLGVLGGYYVIFVLLTWYVFHKRDVAA